MISLKLVHFADLHLDRPFVDMGFPPSVGKARREGLLAILKQIFELAKSEAVDAVTIAGDLYEQDTVMPTTLRLFSEQCERIAPIPVLIAPGQADEYGQDSLYRCWSFPQNVHVFDTKTLSRFCLTPEVTIWGAAYPYVPFSDLFNSSDGVEGTNLLLLHKPNDQNTDGNNREFPRSKHIDFALLGGEHKHRVFPGGIMPGSPEIIEREDGNQDHGITLITIDQTGIHTELISIGRWQFDSLSVDLSDCKNIDQVEACIRQAVKHQIEQHRCYTITLTGTPQCRVDTSYLTEVLGGHIKFIVRLSIPFDLDTLAKEPTVRGFLAKQFIDQIETADPTSHPRILNAAHIALQALSGTEEGINAIESD